MTKGKAKVKELIFFCPECHGLFIFPEGAKFMFENEFGKFIKVWELGGLGIGIKLHDLYLIGEL